MENLEIILTDFNKRKIDKLIYEELKLPTLKISSSHFYNNILEKDLTFSQVGNIEEVLAPKGTGNILLEELQLGILINNVLIVFSFDEQDGDILFNFSESEILKNDMDDNKLRLEKLVHFLVILQEKYEIPKVIIGNEPANDEDSLLMEINSRTNNYDKEIEKILSYL